MRKPSWSRKKSERGFSLIMMSAAAVVMFGMLGLTTDLGRVFIVKNELQAFADASSVAAALQLNGTAAGLTAADAAAASGPSGPTGTYNGWHFDSQMVATPTVTYSTTYGGTYLSFQFTECRCDLQICSGCGVGGRASLFPAHLAGRG